MRILSAALALTAAVTAGPPPAVVRVAPTWTRVGIASVQLELSDLELRGDALVGRFQIHVPLLPSRDDQGTITLRMDAPLEQSLRPGAKVLGSASSETTGPHAVACDVDADGGVRIAVTTSDRVLSFVSHYQVLRRTSGD